MSKLVSKLAVSASVAKFRGRAARDLPLFAFSLLPLMVAGSAYAAGAPALPTGGKVVAGQASIGPASAGSLTVTQSSGKAIINWQGFSIGSGGKVQVNNGSGATLNRVTGSAVSSLNGLLSATGSVYLLNPNGVIVGKSGVVNVGGTFVASTLNLTDSNFLAGGNLAFTGTSNAAVVNLGKIGALGGDVALIAATVDNEGAVTAANGTAGLVSGYSVVMRDASLDDGLFSVMVGGPKTGVTNGGAIIAANAELRAEGGNVYALAGNTNSVIRATGVKSDQGKVWLVADGGTLDVAGAIEAQGAKGAAGAIETSGHTVAIGAASINAHGGSWLVDPVDLTIDSTAATTIDASLNMGTNVTEQTTANGSSGAGTANAAGAGDIIVAAPLSWATGAGLTLSAYRNVDVNASITSTGGGAVTLQADNAATGVGTVAFGGGSVSTAGLTTILYNPTSYTAPTDYTADVSGGGTLAAYMLVNTAAELQAINTNLAGDYALNPGLGDGLDLSSIASFTPIGTDATPFTGVFTGAALDAPGNGEGTISNLTINLPNTTSVGLFGNLGKGGLVENVALEGGSVAGFNAVGGLVGKNSGTVYGVDVDLTVNGNDAVGGVVGKNFANVGDSESGFDGATITGQDYVGGVIGYNTVLSGSTAPSTAVASDIFSAANVSGAGNYIGGLAGYNSAGSIIEANLYGAQFGFNFIGGGSVQGTGATSTGVGGVAGYNAGTISGAQAYYATVTNTAGGVSTGGVVGLNDVGGVISGDSAYVSSITGGNATGGVVGKNYGTVSNSDAQASHIVGEDATGGVVGKNFATVDDDFIVSSSTVSGVNYVGGVVGWNTTPSGSTAPSTAIVEDGSYTGASTRVSGSGNYIGGLVGYNDVGSIIQGSSGGGGQVMGAGSAGEAIGGLVGYNAGAISNSNVGAQVVEAAANPTSGSPDYLGGAVGYNTTTGTLDGVTVAPIAGYNASYGATGIVTGSFSYEGGLAGYNSGAITGSTSSAAVSGTGGQTIAGGLVGFNVMGGTIAGSSASGTVSVDAAMSGMSNYAGGLVGYNDGAISGSSAAGAVGETGTADGSDRNSIGGLVGYNGSNATVANTVATGAVTAQGADLVGGLIGENNGMISSSSAAGAVSVTGAANAFVGGLVGYNVGTIGGAQASFATGSVTIDGGFSYAGGLVGYNYTNAVIGQAYATGAVTDTYAGGGADGANLGGLVGYNDGAVSYAYSLGSVTAANSTDDYLGGLIGYNDADAAVSQAYATGLVSAANGSTMGGVTGINYGAIANSVYFDQTTTGQTLTAGSEMGTDEASAIDTGGGALSPYAMSSYPNLNFGTGGFVIFEGSTRPFLQSEAVADNGVIINLHQLQLAALNPGFSYTLGADIDATPTNGANASDMWSTKGFSPIGTDATSYTGTFNGADATSGANHTISNLTINTPTATSIGLFGNVGAAGTVENVILTGANITGFNAVGTVAGKNSGLVTDVILSNDTVAGNDAVGGVIGKNFGTLAYASAGVAGISGKVTGADYVGGLVGWNTVPSGSTAASTAVVSDSTVTGTVVGSGNYLGGAVGYNDVGSTISNVSAINTAVFAFGDSAVDIGGLVGFNAGSLTGATGVDTVSGTNIIAFSASNVGGVAGYNSGTTGTVQVEATTVQSEAAAGAASSFGGVVGLNAAGGLVTGALAATYVDTSANAVGGIVGKNYGTVTASQYGSFNGDDNIDAVKALSVNLNGNVKVYGQDAVGGIVGKNFGSVSNSIAYSGYVSGRDYVGGVVGWNTTPTGATSGYAPTVSNSSAYNEVVGQMDVGGVLGRNDAAGTLSGSWSDGEVYLQNYDNSDVVGPIGGLVGYNAGAINTSYSGAYVSDNDVNANNMVVMGGLIGENAGAVSDVYSVGTTSVSNGNDAGYTVGGLVGVNGAMGAITRAYASGPLMTDGSATTDPRSIDGVVGALAGTNAGALSNLFFDQSSTGTGTAVGSNTGTVGATRVGGSSNDPYAQATYGAFDFSNTWYIIDGSTRPLLRAEYSTTINNAHQLQLIALDPTASYTLAGAIDASATGNAPGDVWRNSTTADAAGNYGFVPLGSDATPFTGSLQGNGYSISDLTIGRPTSTSVGLIANLGAAGSVEDLTLESADVMGFNAVGGLIGKNSGTLLDVAVYDSTVSGSGGVGGVIGKNFGNAFSLTSNSDVTGSGTYVGGVVGYNGAPQSGTSTATATLSNAVFEGTVTDTGANVENDVGGVVGYNASSGLVINSQGGGTVTGAGYAVGGLVGKNYGGVEFSYVEDSNITGAAAVGGLIGKNFGTVAYDSTEYSTVAGGEYVGGLVGYNGVPEGSGSTTPATVSNSDFEYTVYRTTVEGTATTNAEADVGGVVGFNDPYGQITNVSSFGNPVLGSINTAGTGESSYGGFAVGGVVGKNAGLVSSVKTIGNEVLGSAAVGGAVGKNFGTVNLATVDGGNVVGDEYVGGIVGYNGVMQGSGSTTPAVVSNATAADLSISGFGVTGSGSEADVGGLVGFNDPYGLVTSSAIIGSSITSNDSNSVGGIVGKNYGTVSLVSATGGGEVLGMDSIGGVVGRNFGAVSQAESDFDVYGADYVGGAIGYSGAPTVGAATMATVDQVVATGPVYLNGDYTAGADFGGLIGWNAGTVTNSYSTGVVQNSSGMMNIGGFAGYNTGAISTSYTIGSVAMTDNTGGTNVGAFVGNNAGTLTSTYYDTGINGTAVPGVGTGSILGLTPLTDAQAMMQASYAGFDFTNIWAINPDTNGGYPYLMVENTLSNLTGD